MKSKLETVYTSNGVSQDNVDSLVSNLKQCYPRGAVATQMRIDGRFDVSVVEIRETKERVN